MWLDQPARVVALFSLWWGSPSRNKSQRKVRVFRKERVIIRDALPQLHVTPSNTNPCLAFYSATPFLIKSWSTHGRQTTMWVFIVVHKTYVSLHLAQQQRPPPCRDVRHQEGGSGACQTRSFSRDCWQWWFSCNTNEKIWIARKIPAFSRCRAGTRADNRSSPWEFCHRQVCLWHWHAWQKGRHLPPRSCQKVCF